jgi:hypothetical protein
MSKIGEFWPSRRIQTRATFTAKTTLSATVSSSLQHFPAASPHFLMALFSQSDVTSPSMSHTSGSSSELSPESWSVGTPCLHGSSSSYISGGSVQYGESSPVFDTVWTPSPRSALGRFTPLTAGQNDDDRRSVCSVSRDLLAEYRICDSVAASPSMPVSSTPRPRRTFKRWPRKGERQRRRLDVDSSRDGKWECHIVLNLVDD